MSRFDRPQSPEERAEQLKSQIKQLIVDSGLDTEQAKRTLEQVIVELSAAEQHPMPQGPETAPVAEQKEIGPSTFRICIPKQGERGGEIFQQDIGSFTGRQIARREYSLERLNSSDISRNRLFVIAKEFGFENELSSALQRARNDDPVALDFELSADAEKRGGPVVKIPYLGDQQEQGILEFVKGKKILRDIQISIDDQNHFPLLVTIRAKY